MTNPKRVLVTGASGGLGPAVVDAFLNAGYETIGAARSWSGPEGAFRRISADLTKPDECRRAVEEAGKPDVVVHVMGAFDGGPALAETSDETWDRMLDLNLRSAVYMFRAALPAMLERGAGRLIGVGSRVGVEPVPGLSAYGVSKAALVHLIRTIALETKDRAVTANVVLPSTIDTETNRRAMPKADYSKWVKPESIAASILWLASDRASDVNGAVVPIYGRA